MLLNQGYFKSESVLFFLEVSGSEEYSDHLVYPLNDFMFQAFYTLNGSQLISYLNDYLVFSCPSVQF